MCSGIFNKFETSVEIQITLGSFFYNIYSFCKLSFSFNRIKVSRVYIFFLCNYVIYKSFSRDLLVFFDIFPLFSFRFTCTGTISNFNVDFPWISLTPRKPVKGLAFVDQFFTIVEVSIQDRRAEISWTSLRERQLEERF